MIRTLIIDDVLLVSFTILEHHSSVWPQMPVSGTLYKSKSPTMNRRKDMLVQFQICRKCAPINREEELENKFKLKMGRCNLH